jgi:hypothetical protein
LSGRKSVEKGDGKAKEGKKGGIFRYVDNGFRMVNQLAEEDPADYERLVDLKEKRWEMGLDLFSILEELLAPVTS